MTTDEVHIWQTRAGRPEDVQAAFELLDGAERARALRYRLRRAHDLFVTARALLRQALGHHLGISSAAVALRYGKHGKPELAEESDFRFNLSHSGDTAVLAVSRGREVGIDVEDTSREVDALGLARRFFSRAEAAWVLSHPSELFQAAFFTCWTGKEAYLKARGDGLLFPLDAFEVLPEGDRLNLKVYGDSKETRRWSMQILELGAGLSAAVAVEGYGWTLRVRGFPRPRHVAASCPQSTLTTPAQP